jgi:hypothetical protein
MLVYAALWGHCSKEGVFEYKPRILKLSILPFLDFSLADTLTLLEGAGFIRRFRVYDKEYGFVPSFEKHQRISGKEAQYSPKLPAFTPEKQEGSNGEATGKNQGLAGEAQEKEKEKEKEKEEKQQHAGACDQLTETIEEHRNDLLRLFPIIDIPVATAKLLHHFRDSERLLDPWMTALKWFQREFAHPVQLASARASPTKSKGVLREEAAVEAAQETLRLLEGMRNGAEQTTAESFAGADYHAGSGGTQRETTSVVSAGVG